MTCPEPTCPISSGQVEILDYRIASVEKAVAQIADAVSSIAENTRQLAVLEQRHSETREGLGRAFEEISGLRNHHTMLAERTAIIEHEMPGLKETRADARKLSWIVLSGVVVAVLSLVVITPKG